MNVGVLEIELMANMARLSNDMRRAEKVVGDSMTKVERHVSSARSAMEKLGMGIGIVAVLEQVKQLSDRYVKLDAQLRIATKSQQDYNSALADVRRISTVAQADIGATTMLYTRLMNTMAGTSVTQKQLSTVTETVSYGLKAYGATAAEAASASLQLSQAMGANRLGGEEFRAVMEAMPNVMKVLATSMGVPLGELRALSIAGKITTAEMVKAFADPAIAAEFKRMAMMSRTISGELVVMGNNTMQFVGSLMKATGVTGGAISAISVLSDSFKFLLDNVKAIANLIAILATLYAGKFVMGLVTAYRATLALNAAHVEAVAINLAAAESTATYTWARHVSTGGTMANAAANKVLVATQIELAAAEALHAKATIGWLGKLQAMSTSAKLGLIGVALWGVYTVADSMGWVDKLSDKLGDFFNTQESHIRRLKALGGGGASGDAMSRAIETISQRELATAAADAQKKALADVGITTDVSSIGGASAAIAKLQNDMYKIREGGTSHNDERMLKNIQRAIDVLGEYQIELSKTAAATGVTHATFGSEWLAMVKTERSDAQKRLDKLAELKALYETELGKLTNSTSLADRLKLKNDYLAAIAEINKPSAKAKAEPVIQGMSMMGKMAEEMTAKNIRDTAAMSNLQKVEEAWRAANDEITAAIGGGAKMKQIEKMVKAMGTFAEHEKAAAEARAADNDLEVKRSIDRTKAIDEATAAIQRKQVHDRMTASELIEFDVAAVDILIDKVQTQILLTDELKNELQLRKELESLQAKKEAIKNLPGFMDIFGSKGTESGMKGMFSGMITGAITDWRGMIKSFGDSFKTKVIDFMAQGASDFFSKMMANNPYVAVAAAAIVASGALNKWAVSKQPANVSLTGGRDGVDGGISTLWERDAGWFKQKEQEFRITGLTTKQTAAYNASLQSMVVTYASAGDALGYADAGAQAFTVSLTTNGDVTNALANQIGTQLLPAIVLFQREGENLQQTAQRLTDTFKGTNDLLTATGISSAAAFGGFGLESAAARESLVAASGGLSAFNTNAQGFISNFLTPAEKLAPAADAVARTFEKLGIVGVGTNAQFAQLVKEQLALGNTDVVAQLLSVSSAFDSLTKAAATANAQIEALLDKKLFSTLVDYLRATQLGSSASSAIAIATVGLGSTITAEQAGTASYTATYAADIAKATAESNAAALTEMTNDPSFMEQLLAALKELINGLWLLIRQVLDEFWVNFRDLIVSIPGMIWEAIKGIGQMIVDAIKGVINGIGGGIIGEAGDFLSGGGGQILPGVGEVFDGIFAKGGTFGTQAFASGGSFTNGLYDRPTAFAFADGGGFSNGIMGEAGPEAVMPLRRDSAGRLGVSVNGGDSAVVDEIRALRNEVVQLRTDNRAERSAAINTAQRTERILDKWDHIGMPEVQTA